MFHRFLCFKALIAGPGAFCTHIYGWNMLTRPESTFQLKWSHINFVEDHISIIVNKHKADQGGESLHKERSIYANPMDPIQCPFLALFLVAITFTDRAFNDGKFLYNEKIYGRWMKSATERMTESEHLMYGTYNKLLGPYSIRKGALSLCTCTPGGPPPAEAHLRAGHSLGRTHGAYIHGSAGGDEMTGRVLCGGDLHRTTFASLPPHFRKDLVLTDRELRAIFPAFDSMKTACPSFISCLPYLLASGAQHWDYVKSILKDYPQHVVFHTIEGGQYKIDRSIAYF